MKNGDSLFGTRQFKMIIPCFTILLLASVLTLSPARIKWIALNEQCFSNTDSTLELTVNTSPAIDPVTPPDVSRVIIPKIHFFVGVDIVSGNLYRGPPALAL